jgi:hypothetical protein
LEEGFLLCGVAVGDDVADVAGEGREVVVREWLWLVVGFGEFGAAGFEAGELLGEGGDKVAQACSGMVPASKAWK